MNNTLNALALRSFERKARKIGKHVGVINGMDIFFIPYCIIRAGETLIIWSDENGFHSIECEHDTELAYLVNFPDKYGYDEIYHFGILNQSKDLVTLYRCFDDCPDEKGKMLAFGLQFFTDKYKDERDFEAQQESELTFLQTGNMSWL